MLLGAVGNYANWLQYFHTQNNRTKESIARVFGQLIYLDARRVSLLADIDDCSHFSAIEHLLHVHIRNTDLSNFASTFFAYCEVCLELKKYMGKQKRLRAP